MIPIGTRIKFTKTLEEGPDEYAPSKHFCSRGELGVITGHKGYGIWPYTAKTDSWDASFCVSEEDFTVVPVTDDTTKKETEKCSDKTH